MATLADSFLQDLEDLEDEPGDESKVVDDPQEPKQINPEFLEVVTEVKERMSSNPTPQGQSNDEYDLIERCNKVVAKIDEEIMRIYRTMKDNYSSKFPELESIVGTPIDYIAVVSRIKNEMDVSNVDLADLLPSTIIMAITVAGSMTTGTPLQESDLTVIDELASEAEIVTSYRYDILRFLESRMSMLAPNLSVILGPALASRLISQAGGLDQLSRMPSQNILLLGAGKRQGISGATAAVTQSLITQGDIVQSTPLAFRNRAVKLVAGKCAIAARVDAFKESPGIVGVTLRDHILNALSKCQAPPPAPLPKPMTIPDDKPKPRRGGARHRRFKQKYHTSEYKKKTNRLKFGAEAEEELGEPLGGHGFGMAGGTR